MSEDDRSQDDWKRDDWTPDKLVEFDKPHPNIITKQPAPIEPQIKSESRPVATSMNDQILRGIDNGLDAFGKNVKEVFYLEMEGSKNVKRSEILDSAEQFQGMIEQFFKLGSPLVERCIGREILRIFNLPPEAGLNFKTAVEIVRRHPHKESTSKV